MLNQISATTNRVRLTTPSTLMAGAVRVGRRLTKMRAEGINEWIPWIKDERSSRCSCGMENSLLAKVKDTLKEIEKTDKLS